MRISQEEIQKYVEGFIRRSVRYEGDSDLGVVDKNSVLEQINEIVATALTLDVNAFYYLLSIGVKDETANTRQYLDTLNRIKDLLSSLTVHPKEDPVTEELISKVERALVFSELSSSSTAKERTYKSISTLSRALGNSLLQGESLRVPVNTAKEAIRNYVADLFEQHDLLLADLQQLLNAENYYQIAFETSDLRAKTVGALKNLMTSLRFERLSPDISESLASARQRFIELQTALITIDSSDTARSPATARVLTGSIPEGTDIRISVTGDAVVPIAYVGTKSGGYNIQPGATTSLAVDGAIPVNVLFRDSVLPNVWGEAAPQPPGSPKHFFLTCTIKDFPLGPHEAHILPPFPYHAHGYIHLPNGVTSAALGHWCRLFYVGNRSLLSASNKRAVEATESLLYRVIGFDGSAALNNPRVKLDPPLPTGVFAPGFIQDEWEITFFSPTMIWEVPTSAGAYPTYLDRLKAEFSGPTDISKKDGLQAWRPFMYIAGAVVPGPFFIPGERVSNVAGDKQGIVVYSDATGLYLLEQDNRFSTTDMLTGLESGASINPPLTITTAGVAENNGNAGQPNHMRFVEAVQSSNVLHIRARETLGGGSSATLDNGFGGFGDLLTLALSGNERGLWQLGVSNGDKIMVGGVEYEIDTITNDTTAILKSGGLYNSVAWSVPTPAPIASLGIMNIGLHYTVSRVDTLPLSGYDISQPYNEWNVPVAKVQTDFATELEILAPQTDSYRWLAAKEVVDEIRRASISGLIANEYRETLFRHPDQPAIATLSQGSNIVNVPATLPSDDVVSDLTGCYFIPEEGVHSGREFLIVDDLTAPRRLELDASALVSEIVPAYRIESRKVQLSTATKTTKGSIVFGAGTANIELGFPVSTEVWGKFNTLLSTNNKLPYKLADLGIVAGDIIYSPFNQYPDLTIVALSDTEATVDVELPGTLQYVALEIPGSFPVKWRNFVTTLNNSVNSWQPTGVDLLSQLAIALIPISDPTIAAQIGDVVAFERVLDSLIRAATSTLNTLNSLDLPDNFTGRNIIETINENQLDRARYLLTHGLLTEFLAGSKEEYTRAGVVQSKLKVAIEGLGIPKGANSVDDYDAPETILTDVNFDDGYNDGYLSEQYIDSEDDGEER